MREIKFKGELNLAGLVIPCYVLEDGTRLLSGSKVQEALKISAEGQRAGTRIDKFLTQKSLQPIVSQYLTEEIMTPIECYNGDKKIYCYHAEALADICDCMLEARRQFNLYPRLKRVAEQCEILMRAFARVGITALIDEATGYQAIRKNDELQKILGIYISEEVLKWQLTFSEDFYKELYRLYDIPYIPKAAKPLRVGKLTKKYIYDQLPDGVVEAIQDKVSKTETGSWKYRWHQALTPEVGKEHLKRQILEVTTLMSASRDKKQFKELFSRRYNTPVSVTTI